MRAVQSTRNGSNSLGMGYRDSTQRKSGREGLKKNKLRLLRVAKNVAKSRKVRCYSLAHALKNRKVHNVALLFCVLTSGEPNLLGLWTTRIR